MCGICGEIRFDGGAVRPDRLERMMEVMTPRGPDGAGMVVRNGFGFGHRRLKIIDLSNRADQPLVDAALGLTIAFNGCIYNYPELRKELEEAGYSFFSSGDTEVIIKAWHMWGPESVTRLHGMFAFAMHERDTGRVHFVRDRFGIKPFYLAEVEGGVRFASSLPALVASGGVDTALDPVALHHYMTFHAVVPAPHTILKGVRKLPPATIRTFEPDGNASDRRYWEVNYNRSAAEENRSRAEWEDMLMDALRLSVRRRMVADVPVGVLLSGGVDSSLIVGLLAEAGQHGLMTFSIGFEAANGEKGDEFIYSDIIAKAFGTRHHKLMVPSADMLGALPATIKAQSEPMVSYDNVGFFLLSREVSRHIKVVQSGQGADEVFGGYHWYPPLQGSNDAVGDYSRVFFDRSHDVLKTHLSPRYMAGSNVSFELVRDHMAMPGANDPVDKALRLDSQIMLVDDPVKRVDNMTMAWGLEARVPFLDHELVELAARMPPALKLENGGKGILKDVARKVIPSSVIDREKGYFPVPALKYIEGPVLEMVKDALTSQAARERGLFQPSYLDSLFAAPKEHITPLRGSELWQVALLELWLQNHGL